MAQDDKRACRLGFDPDYGAAILDRERFVILQQDSQQTRIGYRWMENVNRAVGNEVRIRRQAIGMVAIVALVFLTTAGAVQSEDLTRALQQRVEDRWQALLARDHDRVYAFHSPTYRAVFTREHVKRGLQAEVPVSSANLVRVELDAESGPGNVQVATAIVNVRYHVPVPFSSGTEEITNTYRERWLWREGEWWYVPPMPVSR